MTHVKFKLIYPKGIKAHVPLKFKLVEYHYGQENSTHMWAAYFIPKNHMLSLCILLPLSPLSSLRIQKTSYVTFFSISLIHPSLCNTSFPYLSFFCLSFLPHPSFFCLSFLVVALSLLLSLPFSKPTMFSTLLSSPPRYAKTRSHLSTLLFLFAAQEKSNLSIARTLPSL
jgi:hypothetical protein